MGGAASTPGGIQYGGPTAGNNQLGGYQFGGIQYGGPTLGNSQQWGQLLGDLNNLFGAGGTGGGGAGVLGTGAPPAGMPMKAQPLKGGAPAQQAGSNKGGTPGPHPLPQAASNPPLLGGGSGPQPLPQAGSNPPLMGGGSGPQPLPQAGSNTPLMGGGPQAWSNQPLTAATLAQLLGPVLQEGAGWSWGAPGLWGGGGYL